MKNERYISEAALKVLKEGEIECNQFRIVGPRVSLRLYKELDRLFQGMGGKWDGQAKAHVFAADPSEAINKMIATGQSDHPRDYGYFPTPALFAKHLVEKADIHPGMTVLEPSAGQGAIAQHIAMHVGFHGVTLVELLEQNIKVLRQVFPQAIQGDFLRMIPNLISQFDRIVMNPPFHRHIAHVRHAWRFLKPGGKLVSVMAAGVLDRDNLMSQRFREFVAQHGSFERNPDGTFAESGTMVETVIVILNKP